MFDYTTTDLTLAIAHHLLIFALAGVLAFEIATVRYGIGQADIVRIAGVDAWYGILAAAIVVVGVLRVAYAAKGWEYYRANPFFHAKMSAFLIVGLLSIFPTIFYIRWKRAAKADAAFVPSRIDIARIRQVLWLEAGFFALIPVFAAMMARMS